MAAPASDRCGKCAFFVDKKKRFCKMLVAKGHKFCGEHANMDTNVYEDGGRRRIACPLDPKHSFLFHLSFGKSTNCSDKFFCCVVSTVSEDKLHKHLKKCNSRGKPKAVYYVENINAGSADQNEQTLPQVSLCERSATQLRHLLDTLNAASKVFQEEANNPKNGDSAHKHLKQQSSILGHLEALGLLGRGRCFVEFGAGRGKLSHWIHRALREQTPPPPAGEPLQMLLVERSSTRFKARPRTESMRGFGRRPKKGRRAQFGGQRTLASWPPTRPFKIKAALLCVQVDGKHQDADVEFARLQIDIQHLDLSKAPDRDRDRDQSSRDPFSQVKSRCWDASCRSSASGSIYAERRRVRAALKRVSDANSAECRRNKCSSSDLALRCLFPTSSTPRQQAGPPRKRRKASPDSAAGDAPDPCGSRPARGPSEQGPCGSSDPRGSFGPSRVLGLAVALCCHHRCEWRHYVGQKFFSDLGLGPAEFSSFCRMSSWATCGLRAASDQRADEEHEPLTAEETDVAAGFLSPGERERIGRRCKLLIDAGRIEFLRSKGFCGRLTRYVGAQVTLENVLMTATPAGSSPAASDVYS
ncbi:tRNA:m(4)X modification enzyme TRM13 homolog isoform X2 [Phyllopteryx taeniolatus]|uniref:tRNA:m(4)X modification enzyme TRM13 homolog isoform X2 n=1 Tax=Phyllopteryx taeniolatus TaxID=161469 RepID=UPI002AD2C4A0|nr:tRNA:m(4)X modification enzyme TRM13 homolog isoform X2 [Phyllopteryx taeniolatus]